MSSTISSTGLPNPAYPSPSTTTPQTTSPTDTGNTSDNNQKNNNQNNPSTSTGSATTPTKNPYTANQIATAIASASSTAASENTAATISSSLAPTPLPAQTSLLDSLATSNNVANTSFVASEQNEMKSIAEQTVEYAVTDFYVAEKEAYIQQLEEDRMQRQRQKDLLLNLNREKNDLATTSRTQGESVMISTTKKEIKESIVKEETLPFQSEETFEEFVVVSESSQDFNEAFLQETADQKKRFLPDENLEEDLLKQQEDSEQHQKQHKPEKTELEEDEFLEVTITDHDKNVVISKFQDLFNLHTVSEDSEGFLTDEEIEKHILSLTSVLVKNQGSE